MGIIIGVLLIAGGIGLMCFCWSVLMLRGWTGEYYENKTFRQARKQFEREYKQKYEET